MVAVKGEIEGESMNIMSGSACRDDSMDSVMVESTVGPAAMHA